MAHDSDSSRAWVFTARGDPASILSLTSRPLGESTPKDHVAIRVSYTALNQGSLYQMALVPAFLRHSPNIPEMDLSGVVTRVGDTGSPKLAVGDEVAAMIPASYSLSTGEGALAEDVVVPASCVVKLNGRVNLADAAGCLLVGMTAWQQVSEARVKKDDRVLVNAASGGIGTMVIQMARRLVGENGFIVGICSAKNSDMVKDLGANSTVNYASSPDLPKDLERDYGEQPFDAIIDTIGHQSLYSNSPRYLTPEGIYSSVGIKPPAYSVPSFLRAVLQMKLNEWWPTTPWLGGVGRWWRGVSMMNPTLEDRERIVRMLQDGEIRVVTDSIWHFEDAKEAYDKLAQMHARGKILIQVNKS